MQRDQGRPLAALCLLLFALMMASADPAPLRTGRALVFDEFQSIFPREAKDQPVVIVDIDEATLAALGQWPWPRNYLAALIDAVNQHHPAAIGLDIIMPEADRTSPQAIVESRPDLPNSAREALLKSASNDQVLRNSMAHAPVVLGAAGFLYNTSTTLDGLMTREISTVGKNPVPWVTEYPYVLASLPAFQTAAKGQGILSNTLEKGVLRKATLLASINSTLTPGFALEVIRVAQHAKQITVATQTHGVHTAQIAGYQVPLQSNGELYVYYDRPSTARYISALSVLKQTVAAERIAGKMVLIGLTGLGLQDMISTPTNEQRPGVEVHAQVIENIFAGQTLLRPWWMRWVEIGVLLALGAVLIGLLPGASFAGVLRKIRRPSTQQAAQESAHIAAVGGERRKHPRVSQIKAPAVLLALVVVFVLLFGTGLWLFSRWGLLFDPLSPFIGLAMVLACLFICAAIEFEKQLKETNLAFQHQRVKAAQIVGELNAARRIQLATLPDPTAFNQSDHRFDIEAMLEPARQVGGDLYDFFMIDDAKLFFIVGDVAGKGLPACLYMVVSKALAKSAAINVASDIGDIISHANTEMCRENPEMLFVTALAGVLDLNTGQLQLVNAGHDAPWLISSTATIQRLKGKTAKPPLGIVEDLDYPCEHYQLNRGDVLLLVTDGIHEAMNEQQDLYSTERITALLETMPRPHTTSSIAQALREDVRRFVGETEASDDLTMLVLQWNG